MWKFYWLFIGIVVLVAGNSAAEVDLSVVPRYLAYESEGHTSFNVVTPQSVFTGSTVALMDVDGDGWQDFITAKAMYIAAHAYRGRGGIIFYQANIPPEFVPKNKKQAGAYLFACPDLNDDGQDDLVAWGHTEDRSRWFFWIMNPTTGQVQTEFFMAGGKDIRTDGIWDGNYYVVGTLPVDTGQETVQALIIGCTVGYDRYGRGMMAVDPRDGTVLWRYQVGPNPFLTNTRIADIDNDGQAEIVFIGRAPANLDGELVNGTSDDETRLFVLDRQGQLRWERSLGGSYGNGELDIGDMDGDGLPEIITCARTTPKVWGEIVIWDHTGQSQARLAAPTQFRDVNIIHRTGQDYPSILTVTGEYQLREYRFTGQDLILHESVQLSSLTHINLVQDILPNPGTEIFVSCHQGPAYILGSDLKPLMTVTREPAIWYANLETWQPNATTTLLIAPTVRAPFLTLHKAPFAWQRLAPLAWTSGTLAVFGGLLLAWRRPRKVDARLMRETRLNLLENLELSNHGAIAPLKCVRRLVWHLRALQTDLADNNKVEIRMREAWTECHDSALPHLKGILDRAQMAGLASNNIAIVANAVVDLEKHLDILAQNNFQAATQHELAECLEKAERQADNALIRLRAEVATDFHADLNQVMTRVHVANKLALEQNNITFQIGQMAQAAGTEIATAVAPAPAVGLCDPRELEFVLDNLVGNAITAMKEAPTRQLLANWKTTDGMVIIDITDTGSGLAEKDWERALSTRFSTKANGGEGLPNSRKYLRKYGGNLTIIHSVVGKGTTFRVTIPLR